MWWLWLLAAIVLIFGFVVFRGAPYVPTRKRDIILAFDELYPLDVHDLLVDIGSGDGVILREASRRNARAVGYELNPLLVGLSWLLCRRYQGVRIELADFWKAQFPDETTVVYTFGDSRDITKMAEKTLDEARRLNKSLMFISYGFLVPGRSPIKTVGAHYLYRLDPLQASEA